MSTKKTYLPAVELKEKRRQRQTLQALLTYLQEMGLSVYGQNVRLDSGEIGSGSRHYDTAEEILAFRRHQLNGTLWYDEKRLRGDYE